MSDNYTPYFIDTHGVQVGNSILGQLPCLDELILEIVTFQNESLWPYIRLNSLSYYQPIPFDSLKVTDHRNQIRAICLNEKNLPNFESSLGAKLPRIYIEEHKLVLEIPHELILTSSYDWQKLKDALGNVFLAYANRQ